MKKVFKLLSIIFAVLLVLFLFACGIIAAYFYSITKNEVFDSTKMATSNLQIEVYDNGGKIISDKNQFNNQHIALSTLKEDTINAFISIEDKNFYNHKGINKKRI